MATTFHLRCPHCQTAFRATSEQIGRRGRCSHCGGTVPIEAPPGAQVPQAKMARPSQNVGVGCRLCGTRLYGSLEDVGKLLKCPDCGVETVLTPPEVERSRTPAAMSGDQYELWEEEEQPWGTNLKAAESPRLQLECRVCQTLLSATVDQIGQKIKCPDCGALTLVKKPKPIGPARQKVLTDDDYEVEAAAAAPPADVFDFFDIKERAPDDLTPVQRERRERLEQEFVERPKLPSWPLLTSTFSFLFTAGARIRWIYVSMNAVGMVGLGIWALEAIIGAQPAGTGISGDAGNVIIGVCYCLAAVIVGIYTMMYLSAVGMAIVTDSSEGNKEVHAWPPPNPVEWFPAGLYMVIAAMTAAFPGWAIAKLVGLQDEQIALAVVASLVVCYPITLLSQLDHVSVFGVVSTNLLMSLLRAPLSWLGFYIQTALLVAGGLAMLLVLEETSLYVILAILPIWLAGLFFYWRLLGRLAWVIGEATPDRHIDEKEAQRPVAS